MADLLTSQQALAYLSLSGNHRYIGYLVKRNLLPRIEIGPRTFRYDPADCDKLLAKAKKGLVQLTVKP